MNFILSNRDPTCFRLKEVTKLVFQNEEAIQLPQHSTIHEVLVAGVFFDSKSQAKKNFKPKQRKHSHGLCLDSFGQLSYGLHEFVVGKLNFHVFVWKDKTESDPILDKETP